MARKELQLELGGVYKIAMERGELGADVLLLSRDINGIHTFLELPAYNTNEPTDRAHSLLIHGDNFTSDGVRISIHDAEKVIAGDYYMNEEEKGIFAVVREQKKDIIKKLGLNLIGFSFLSELTQRRHL